MTDFKSYKGEIGRLEFLKTLFACCAVNWILSTIITIAASAISPVFILLYVLCLYVNVLIMFCYKKRGQSIFKNEIISWIIAGYAILFSTIYGFWSLLTCVYFNLLSENKINEIPFFNDSFNFIMYFGYLSIPLTIILLVYLFIPARNKTRNE